MVCRDSWYGYKHSSLDAISIAPLMAVVIVLAKIKDMRLDNWNFFLQPNTVISALVVVSKSSLLYTVTTCLSQLKWHYFWGSKTGRRLKDLEIFDDASHGPVNFYMRMRTTVPIDILASFAMLLALFMGPFSQQVVSIVTLPAVSPKEIASIPISNIYNGRNVVPSIDLGSNSPFPIYQS